MDEQLRLLIALQKLDSSMLSLRLKIDSLPSQLSSASASHKEALKAFENSRLHQQTLEKKKRDLERRIEETQDKIQKMRSRSSEIKTNKEYQAHLKEIETSEREIGGIEDQILTVMEALEASTKALAAEKTRLDAETKQEEGFRKEREAETRTMQDELTALKEQRKALAGQIEPDIHGLYMTLLKVGRGLAVAEVRKEICQGCHLNIPPQLFVQIKSGGEIFQCPQCRRILFHEKEEPESPATGQEA